MSEGESTRSYGWLSAGALVALALAVFVAVVALRHAAEDHTRALDVKAKADHMMQRIEAETSRLENEAAGDTKVR